ncbi:chromosome segregation protein SMC [Stutzerimonas xanthomarina]|uniref:Chromosome segregation protein SMC n=1 Tax=Stutzerimonas xanthomarina TaxID=271420 RepID=A0A3R8U8X8_9GAMM|nr:MULTISPECIES: AAA family ATPase [Stutzerimonas]RRV13882.1 chromosome segregation protein SMC [Stutzerimonas xanthomarina]GLZ27721.1 chromosome segregation protein SMC [Stutzerimonas stutzeri]
MSKLNSITLSNLRKFGAGVEIELSPGATIVLAPNGTGKTTLFEAIEFGLTGRIARLHDDIKHVIRDDEEFAQVSLNFADFTATSKITAAGNVSQEGDLTTLFPGIPENDLPFLLRLTHLLDQRENEWIVKADEKDAGSQLAKLPIGREGSRVGATLPSVRRSLTEQKNREQQGLIDLEKELGEWNRLIQERDIAAAGAIGALRPQEHLAKAISEAAVQTQSLDQIPPGLLSEPVNQDTLALAQSALLDILRIKVERVQALIVGLAEADGLVESFSAVRSRLDALNTQLASANETLDSHSKIRTENATLLQEHQTNIQLAQQELVSVGQALERLVNEAGARQQVDHRNQALTEVATAVRNAEEQCAALQEKHERNLQIRNQHTQLDNQFQSLDQTEKQLREGQRLVIEWEATEERLNENRKESDLLEEVLAHLGAELAEKRAAQEACKAAEDAARVHYQALSSSADAIRQAVASIAEHLPPEQESCPLCLHPHGAAELQDRVAKALQAINPSLTSADQRLKAALEALAASDAEVATALEAVGDCQAKLAALDDIRQVLEREIVQFRIDPILASDSVPLAKESLRVQLDGISSSRKSLINRRAGLEPLVAQEVFEQALHAYEIAVAALDQARVQHSEALTRLDQAVATLSALTTGTPIGRTLEELTVQKNQLDDRITELNGKVNTVQSALDAQQSQLLELRSAVRTIEEAIRYAQSQLASLRASWQGLGLVGDPLAEAAQARASTLRSTLVDLERNLRLLENLGVEISAWAKLNESQLAQRLIDAQRLDRSEESFFAYLNDRIAFATGQLADLTKLSDAMDALDAFLKKEIGNVQKHVSKVVPRWQALLKRVVRETRFHEASLKFFTHYNKERAEVSVPLGNKSAPVPDVASEAQLTDLQLTFLLSMAMSHQWSPWKALLLDDPTQHHDLVHASAVFDVLRDYIVDHGFQVVIATHDALQARYFLRKLQNDGIDAKIWTLVPTEHGVTADEGHWKQRIR